jgi:translation initiation factor IF-2
MTDEKTIRLSQAARELNVGTSTITDTLATKGFVIENKPNTKITLSQLKMLAKEFEVPLSDINTSSNVRNKYSGSDSDINTDVAVVKENPKESSPSSSNNKEEAKSSVKTSEKPPITQETKKEETKEPSPKEENTVPKTTLRGLTVVDKIDLDQSKRKQDSSKDSSSKKTVENKEKPEVKKPQEKDLEAKVEAKKEEKPEVKKPQEKDLEAKVEAKKEEKPEVKKPQEKAPEANIDENKVTLKENTESKKGETSTKEDIQKITNKESPKNTPIQTTEVKIEKENVAKKSNEQQDTKNIKTPPTDKGKENSMVSRNEAKNNPAEQKATDKVQNNSNDDELIKGEAKTLKGLTILGKIELPSDRPRKGGKPVASSDDRKKKRKRKKKRIERPEGSATNTNNSGTNTTTTTNTTGNSNNRPTNTTGNSNNRPTNTTGNSNNRPTNTTGNSNNRPTNTTGNSNNRPTNTTGNSNNRPTNTTGNSNNRPTNTTGNSNNSSTKPKTNNTNSGSSTGNRPNNSGNSSQNNNANNRGRTRNKVKSKDSGNQSNEISNAEIQSQIKATLAKMSTRTRMGKKSTRSQRKDRNQASDVEEEETNLLQVTEFISASDLSSLMDVSVNEVISTCMNIGMFVSINQRLDAEAITIIADEFNFDVEFISAVKEDSHDFEEVEEAPEDLKARAPIVTIMGHVDHGKTSLLDYIRKANVTSQESGGITQHIGAYDVMTSKGQRIVFLDTPGHEAFTAMRARGARVTDIVILVVAADDDVMPQTKEALNHAQVAGVPIVIAINKVDKDTANPEKIKEGLSKENVLVESWGGKYQDQEISAKTGIGVEDLLEKVLLEAELLELTANPDKKATGTVIEASLDKGRGYVATVLVQSGTLQVGDVILAGSHYGRVKAMNDHLGRKVSKAYPATPVQVLGLVGAPQSGDVFKAMNSEREAREIASKREQILREQNIRATRGLTLDEITRRRLLGNFQELKIIVKGDVDGSVEALADSLQKLSSKEIEIKIIHKAVGQISEADVMLASASEAIIVGFQVRPSPNARKAAEQEKVQIKLYSIIYNAIEEIRDAMEGMLAPTIVEEIVGNAEVRNVFKISKIGTVAGCYVTDGYIKRSNRVRLIRDGIVTFEGEIDALKRFKEDVNEVRTSFECGMSIKGFNDIKEGDIIENYEIKEVKRKL